MKDCRYLRTESPDEAGRRDRRIVSMTTPEWERLAGPIEMTDSGEIKVCVAVGAVVDNPEILTYFCDRTGEQCRQVMMKERGNMRTGYEKYDFPEAPITW